LHANFLEPKKDTGVREQKQECLIELIDFVQQQDADFLNEKILAACIHMVGANIFRTFANKSKAPTYSEIIDNKKGSAAEQDEDEPKLEEAWPHLQLVYELLLKLIMHAEIDSAKMVRHLSESFLIKYLDLLDSEDPRERDYLKTILHRIYGKYLALRPTIKRQIMNTLLRITQLSETHNGMTELLELLASITNGLSVPLKEEHSEFFKMVIVPLHKVKELSTFNNQLAMCVKNYLQKQLSLALDLVKCLLKFWPLSNPAKQIIFISQMEDVMELIRGQSELKFAEVMGPEILAKLIQTSHGMHFQAAEKSLLLLNSELCQKLVRINMAKCYPVVVKGLLATQQEKHWNSSVTNLTFQTIRVYMEMSKEHFEKYT
jgi:serine/threonine-protein phosphatase 2A regulatory subunit B'